MSFLPFAMIHPDGVELRELIQTTNCDVSVKMSPGPFEGLQHLTNRLQASNLKRWDSG